MSGRPLANADRCPRCGAAFVCGAAGPGPCGCTSLALGAALQARLREQFVGCLCLGCLRELAQADEPPPADQTRGAAPSAR